MVYAGGGRTIMFYTIVLTYKYMNNCSYVVYVNVCTYVHIRYITFGCMQLNCGI